MRSLLLLTTLLSLSLQVSAQGIITTVAGGGNGGDGSLAVNAYIDAPNDVLVDDTGNIYIATDLTIRKVSAATGIISTLAGNPGCLCCTGGDGIPFSQARFCGASALALDKNGNLYIADNGNHVIRKVDKTTGIITKIAGNWTAGYSGDGGLATSAQLGFPNDIALDTAGNLYIADERYVIRKVDAQTGIISTIAGNGVLGTWLDGQLAVNGQLGEVHGIETDANGNIYFSVSNYKIGKISAAGIISTFCGTGAAGSTGDGGLATNAKVACPAKMGLYKAGLYFAEGCFCVIRQIDFTTNVITTVAGNQISGFSGDGGPALQAQLTGPLAISFDTSNNMFIADSYNYRIRKVSGVTEIEEIAKAQFQIYPNPSSGIFQVKCSSDIQSIDVYNALGSKVSHLNVYDRKAQINIANESDGLYVLKLICEAGMVSKKIIIHHF